MDRWTLLTTIEAAAYLSVRPRTLENWRTTRLEQIPFYQIGRQIRYAQADLDRWIEAKRRDGGYQTELDFGESTVDPVTEDIAPAGTPEYFGGEKENTPA